MQKIIIIGCPGSGKSTFARELHRITEIPLYHLDMMYWNPDRTVVLEPVFLERLKWTMDQEQWIIDGNYGSTMEMRLQACDTVFFLNYPVEVCIDGIERRRGTKRDDIPWVEAVDDVDEEFVNFVKQYNEVSRPKVIELLKRYDDKNENIFMSRTAAEDYLRKLEP